MLSSRALFALVIFQYATAEPNDWVNPQYVVYPSVRASGPDTLDAQRQILALAMQSTKSGPWTVVNSPIRPPNGDAHSYLSWAPYHWPDCHWCSDHHKRHPLDLGATLLDPSDDTSRPDPDLLQPAPNVILDSQPDDSSPWDNLPPDARPTAAPQLVIPSLSDYLSSTPMPIMSSLTPSPVSGAQQTSTRSKPTSNPTPCTPSPTKSIAPSATWTTCPYKTRDGHANPDVRQLSNVKDITTMTQSVLLNAISFALNGSLANSQSAVSAIETFFFNPATAMKPNMDYGQVIRGPGRQVGSYMGILDTRGIVKLVNAILVLRATRSPHWTADKDQQMRSWASQYERWLITSTIGRKSGQSVNNHGTFWMSQMTALKILQDDISGARSVLQYYYSHQYQDQIVGSGEQPFEAVRTRPFHYRCFNLEAMIVNAKLGDYIGLDFWTTKTRYGATIQTAVDFLMNIKAKSEEISEVYPHIAAIAAAYGDPYGRYSSALRKGSAAYTRQPYWFYDQSSAFGFSPVAVARRTRSKRQEEHVFDVDLTHDPKVLAGEATWPPNINVTNLGRPATFGDHDRVELDEGVFVTWDELRPYFLSTFSG